MSDKNPFELYDDAADFEWATAAIQTSINSAAMMIFAATKGVVGTISKYRKCGAMDPASRNAILAWAKDEYGSFVADLIAQKLQA